MAESMWWQSDVLYEVLVPSFQDSDGDGWGDLRGILRRLDYLTELGVGAVWLSPFYRTGMCDIGYDVIDHTAVDPRFGTLEDFESLLAAAHERNLRIVIDYVPNHTSDQHPWFQQSRSSRDAPKRSWYIWADPHPGGGPPNNWVNRFGRSAWTFDPATEQYYFGTFTPQQPDLNWRHPEVQQAMLDILRLWLDRGVDGVRVDALPHLIKDDHLRDNPKNLSYTEDQEPSNRLAQSYSQNQPELIDTICQMRQVIDEYQDRVLIGEAYQSPEQIAAYQRAGAHLLLSTSMLQVQFNAPSLRQMIDYVEAITPDEAWPSRSSGNHDIPRLAERVGPANLRLAALLQFTVRGAASTYYGDELGLLNIAVPPEKMWDPSGRDDARYGRDRFRVPMPWNREPNAGFTTGDPWLPIDQATIERNVADQLADPNSLLDFYRRILQLRSAEADLQTGAYIPVDTDEPILAFRRGDSPSGLLIAANISDAPTMLDVPGIEAQIILSTACSREPSSFQSQLQLEAREGIVARIIEDPAGRAVAATPDNAGG